METEFIADVSDLVGRPESGRDLTATIPVTLEVGDSRIDGPAQVTATVRGTTGGVISSFDATAQTHQRCVRCLVEWDEPLSVEGQQHYAPEPDEDGYAVVHDQVDLGGPAIDELSLALDATPTCQTDCKGLCPVCGNDLNTDPCNGHGEESDSPFAVLKDLFDS